MVKTNDLLIDHHLSTHTHLIGSLYRVSIFTIGFIQPSFWPTIEAVLYRYRYRLNTIAIHLLIFDL
jgi:hypothetical protein